MVVNSLETLGSKIILLTNKGCLITKLLLCDLL